MSDRMEDRLGTAPVGRLMLSLAAPAVLGQLVHLLYNVVDRIYVGRIADSGTMALAGLGITFPIIIMVNAFAQLIAMGGAPRAAIAMGEKDHEKAEKLLGNSVTLLTIFSVVLGLLFYYIKDFVLLSFGASENSLPYASQYLSVYLAGTLFTMYSLGLNMFISCQGFAGTAMASTCIGCGLNIGLDPLFIFTFGMGVRGAAIATIISQGVSALFVMLFLAGKKTGLRIRFKYLRLRRPIILSIVSLGVSAFVMQATECAVQLLFNRGMLAYGNDLYVALMSILFSLMQLLWLPMNGIGQGVQAMVSYNYGAGQYARVRKTFSLLIRSNLIFSVLSVTLFELFPGLFLGLFTPDQPLIELGKQPLRLFLIGMSVMGAQCACQQTFLALGQAKASLFVAVLRKVVLLIPLALILPRCFSLGVWGLFLAEPISDVISVTVCVCLFASVRRKVLPE